MKKSMLRAERAARRVPHGPEILEFLTAPKTRKMLISAAAAGAPPVSAISREFADLVGPKSAKLAQVKQYVGLCIRAVLEQEGYDIERTGVWLGNDPVFTTGSLYKKVSEQSTARRDDWLDRFVRMLTSDEADRLSELLRRRSKR